MKPASVTFLFSALTALFGYLVLLQFLPQGLYVHGWVLLSLSHLLFAVWLFDVILTKVDLWSRIAESPMALSILVSTFILAVTWVVCTVVTSSISIGAGF